MFFFFQLLLVGIKLTDKPLRPKCSPADRVTRSLYKILKHAVVRTSRTQCEVDLRVALVLYCGTFIYLIIEYRLSLICLFQTVEIKSLCFISSLFVALIHKYTHILTHTQTCLHTHSYKLVSLV